MADFQEDPSPYNGLFQGIQLAARPSISARTRSSAASGGCLCRGRAVG